MELRRYLWYNIYIKDKNERNMQIVPQYIDVEDRIAGPLTWKHLGWIFGGSGILLIAFTFLDTMTFFIVAIPTGIMTVALAFYKPNGISLISFLGYGFTYLFHPKTYTWQREMSIQKKKKQKKNIKISITSKKEQITIDDITAIAKTLDSGGRQRNERIQELIKERIKKDKKK